MMTIRDFVMRLYQKYYWRRPPGLCRFVTPDSCHGVKPMLLTRKAARPDKPFGRAVQIPLANRDLL